MKGAMIEFRAIDVRLARDLQGVVPLPAAVEPTAVVHSAVVDCDGVHAFVSQGWLGWVGGQPVDPVPPEGGFEVVWVQPADLLAAVEAVFGLRIPPPPGPAAPVRAILIPRSGLLRVRNVAWFLDSGEFPFIIGADLPVENGVVAAVATAAAMGWEGKRSA